MTCYACGFEAPSKDFGIIELHTISHGVVFRGYVPGMPNNPPCNPFMDVRIFACPECGAIHSDLAGYVKRPDRKPE